MRSFLKWKKWSGYAELGLGIMQSPTVTSNMARNRSTSTLLSKGMILRASTQRLNHTTWMLIFQKLQSQTLHIHDVSQYVGSWPFNIGPKPHIIQNCRWRNPQHLECRILWDERRERLTLHKKMNRRRSSTQLNTHVHTWSSKIHPFHQHSLWRRESSKQSFSPFQ